MVRRRICHRIKHLTPLVPNTMEDNLMDRQCMVEWLVRH